MSGKLTVDLHSDLEFSIIWGKDFKLQIKFLKQL